MGETNTQEVETGWRWLLDRTDIGPEIREMVEAAGRRSDLRHLFPYLSLDRTLRFSHTTESPYTERMPRLTYLNADSTPDGSGYEVLDATLKPARFDNLAAALSHLAALARKRPPDVEAVVRFLSTDSGGRKTPAQSGYKPCHEVRADYLTTGEQTFIDHEWVAPGESVRTLITFVSPEAYPNCLRPGQVIRVQEASRVIGHAEIVEVLNPDLLAAERDGQDT